MAHEKNGNETLAAAIATAMAPHFLALQMEIRTGLTQVREEFREDLTGVRHELGELRQEMHAGFAMTAAHVDALGERIGNLERAAVGVARISALEERVTALERRG